MKKNLMDFFYLILFFILPHLARADEFCTSYQDAFPNGDLQQFSSLLLNKTTKNGLGPSKSLYFSLRGYENPYVSLAAAYAQLNTNDLANSLFNLDFSIFLFKRSKLCADATFDAFILAARVEIVSKLNAPVGEKYSFLAQSLIKEGTKNNLQTFPQYLCALKEYNITVQNNQFYRCIND